MRKRPSDDDDEPSFIDSVRSLAAFCCDGSAKELKTIYETWTYYETVLYGQMLLDRRRMLNDQISEVDSPLAMMLLMLHQRLR